MAREESPNQIEQEPVAYAYDDVVGGLVASIYELEAAQAFRDIWWTRVEIVDEEAVLPDKEVENATE